MYGNAPSVYARVVGVGCRASIMVGGHPHMYSDMTGLEGLPGLHPRVINAVRERGWRSLTPLQLRAAEEILSGNNVLIMASTGSGKTEAALLPVFSMMLASERAPFSLLYVTPMKALINDLYSRVKWWAERLGFRVARKHGDTSTGERMRRLRERPDILIITPESLEIDLDWAHKARELYRNVRWVIVDEVHELLNGKRGAQFLILLERLKHYAGRDFQRIGLSATLGRPDQALEMLSGSSKRPRKIVVGGDPKRLDLKITYVSDRASNFWSNLARKVLEEIEKPSLVFVNSRYMSEKLKDALEKEGAENVYVHHSSVSPRLREEAERNLKEGAIDAIVCTKTLEVGIDVGSIRKVVQVKSPGKPSSLLQRVGRSGHRLNAPARGTIIAVGGGDLLESLAVAILARKGEIEPLKTSRIPRDVIAKAIQGILLEKGEASLDEIYKLVSSHPKTGLSREDYERLIDYLEQQGVIRISNGKARLGATFYKIWRFRGGDESRTWWSRSFSEFFTMIGDRDTFVVKHGGSIIGYIDSVYVYRFLRPGDVIRLSGASWTVTRIDENTSKIEVEPSNGIGEVPLWMGETVRRPKSVALKLAEILWTEKPELEGIKLSPEAKRTVSSWRKYYLGKVLGGPIPREEIEKTVIYERYGDEHILTIPLGSGANETLALLASYQAVKEAGMSVYYKSNFMGFSIYTGGSNPLNLLSSLDPENIESDIERALESSPHFYQTLREIRIAFGKLGGIGDDGRDDLLVEEAREQVKDAILDVETAKQFLEKLNSGEIRIITPLVSGLTPLAREILKSPKIRPWLPDLAGRIAKLIEGTALTVEEIADILGLSEKTVENKLREMRKPEYASKRAVAFVDVDTGEWRWTLARTLSEVAESEEFESSFRPSRRDDPYRVIVQLVPRASATREVIVTPETVESRWREIARYLPEESYKVKIISAYDYGGRDDVSITYFNTNRDNLRLLLLNAATYIQAKNIYF